MQNAQGEWRAAIKRLFGRRVFANYEKAVRIVKALDYPQEYKDATIVDAYPGPGVFAAALHNEINPKKHILLEPISQFNKYLSELKTPNTVVSSLDPYRWSSFASLVDSGELQLEREPFDRVNTKVLFTASLLHAQGEQLTAQYLNCISNRSWLQRYGRIRMLLWMRASVAEKILAGPNDTYRHRIGVQTESCCDTRVVLHTPTPAALKKSLENYPAILKSPLLELDPSVDVVGSSKIPMTLLELTPKEHQVKHLDEFEYVVKKLFILRSTPLHTALTMLGPGAVEDLSPQLSDLLDKKPTQLTLHEFERITDTFYRWPFKPDFLFDFYEESRMGLGTSTEDSRT